MAANSAGAPPCARRCGSNLPRASKGLPDFFFWRENLLAVLALAALGLFHEWDRLVGPTLIGMDTATAFYPWFTFLGEQLRAGHIPTWNPHQFSGAPFAADPESGWMYLPAMLTFTLLPLEAAARSYLLLSMALATLSMYALARTLGATVFGGVLAASVYVHSGFFEGHNVCCFAYAGVAAWLPLAFLGTELAVRAGCWQPRALWWGVAGLALSQIFAIWVGQGAYYAVLAVGGHVGYCTLLAPGRSAQRLFSFAQHLAGVLAFALCLAAAGLLPRLEYNLLSNLPGGYPEADVRPAATSWSDWGVISGWDRLLLRPGFEFIGWPTLALLVAAPILARRRFGVPYFVVFGLAVLVLARAEPTPLHAVFGALPGFERIHARSPERALIVFYVAPALLAAATISALHLPGRPRLNLAVGALALVVVSADLHAAWDVQQAESRAGGGDYQLQPADLATYYAPTDAARFLLSRAESDRFRYFGYAQHVFGGPMPYTLRWADPAIAALEVNNRAVLSGLDDIQGYNPIHVARYDGFIASLNGHSQNYHHADVFDSGLNSPLLNVLNVRYILVPAVTASDEVAAVFDPPLPTVYQDDQVRVLENPSALPRAWLVHTAQQVGVGGAAPLLARREVDPRDVALLEEPPPPLAEPEDRSADQVAIVSSAADQIQLRVRTTAAGLVVLSEVYYPAWTARVDGQPARVYVADDALRAVAVPTGEHAVELRYESPALLAGLIVSGMSGLTLAALAMYTARAALRRPRL